VTCVGFDPVPMNGTNWRESQDERFCDSKGTACGPHEVRLMNPMGLFSYTASFWVLM